MSAKLPSECPSCGEALEVTRLTCPGCAMQLEGRFELSALARLPGEDLGFIVDFVRTSGSLKEMGKLLGLSYPTVRNRLNEIIERLSRGSKSERSLEEKRRKILDAIASGELSVKDAARKLKELEP